MYLHQNIAFVTKNFGEIGNYGVQLNNNLKTSAIDLLICNNKQTVFNFLDARLSTNFDCTLVGIGRYSHLFGNLST